MSRSSVLDMLAHLWVGLLRNLKSGSRTIFFPGLLQPQGLPMLPLVCLHRRDNYRFRLDSPILWLLPLMMAYSASVDSQATVHHALLLTVGGTVETVVPEKVIPSRLLLNVAMPIMLMLRRLGWIRLL